MVMFAPFPALILMCEQSDHQDSIQMMKIIRLNEFPYVEMDSELVVKFEMMGTILKMMDDQVHVWLRKVGNVKEGIQHLLMFEQFHIKKCLLHLVKVFFKELPLEWEESLSYPI